MIPVAEALAIVLAHTPDLGAEEVPLSEAAARFLASDIRNPADLPPFDRSAMDGYAVRAADVAGAPVTLEVAFQVRAGQMPTGPLPPGQAAQVMTGAPIPSGATAVQPVEKTRAREGGRRVEILETVAAGAHIARRGAESAAGDLVLVKGLAIDAAAVAVLATVGHARVSVGRRPTVSILVTGDELVDVWETPALGRIRNSNGYAVAAQARAAGAEVRVLDVVPDEPERIAAGVREGLSSDVLILSGGVSEGVFDLVEEVLSQFHVSLLFTKVAVKPGAPLVFGRRGDTLVFGLPGNPVSAQVTFDLFVRPALLRMQGAAVLSRPVVEVVLEEAMSNRSARANHLPVRLRMDGGRLAAPIRTAGSADVVAHARANALVILPAERKEAAAGERALALLGNFLERDGQ